MGGVTPCNTWKDCHLLVRRRCQGQEVQNLHALKQGILLWCRFEAASEMPPGDGVDTTRQKPRPGPRRWLFLFMSQRFYGETVTVWSLGWHLSLCVLKADDITQGVQAEKAICSLMFHVSSKMSNLKIFGMTPPAMCSQSWWSLHGGASWKNGEVFILQWAPIS